MLPKIQSNETSLYPIEDFEDYYEINENTFLIMSYFHNDNINEDMCQWHLAEKITSESSDDFFKPKLRLGSSYIYFENQDLQFWKDVATAAYEK